MTTRKSEKLMIKAALSVLALIAILINNTMGKNVSPGRISSASPYAPALAALSDFGFENMKINGRLAIGHRPLLVIVANFDGGPDFVTTDFDDYVFNLYGQRSVSGYYRANSNGRFFWSRAGQGVLGPYQFTQQERNDYRMDDPKGISYVIKEAARRGGFDFAPFDDNGDKKVAQDELMVLIIHNGEGLGARNIDPSGCLKPDGSSVQICGNSNNPNENRIATSIEDFDTICHELCHTLGAIDLYGGSQTQSQNLTLMGSTLGGNGDEVYHLDPWHKIQLGWSEPRIRSLNDGGVESLPAMAIGRLDTPVLLYDPVKGVREFFILEYRTPSNPSGYEQNVAGTGLAIWRIQQDSAKNPTRISMPNGDYNVFHSGAPNFQRGGNMVWGGNGATPFMSWLDGIQTKVKVFVRPFGNTDGSITVEWLHEKDVWVDFNYAGFIQEGTFDHPFNTMAAGVAAVPYGGTLKIKAGSGVEAIKINKKVKIESYGGSVTIAGRYGDL